MIDEKEADREVGRRKSDWDYDYNVPINKAIGIVNELAEEYRQDLDKPRQDSIKEAWKQRTMSRFERVE